MNKHMKRLVPILILSALCILYFVSCNGKKNGSGGVITLRLIGDPDRLNPITTRSAHGRTISDIIFSSIYGIEPKGDFHLLPIMMTEVGKMTEVTDGEFKGGMKIDFEIRPEARWDNGSSITADDYIFTVKSVLNPKVQAEALRPYYASISDIVVDPANNRKFSVYSREKYFKFEEVAASYILPEYNYDPEKIMRKFTLKDLEMNAENLKSNPDINKFADEFNSEKFKRDPAFISGCGPYRLESWTTGQEVVLRKKDSWWGDQFKDMRQFWAFPKKIKYKIIPDQNTAITALKDGAIDAYEVVPAKDYEELSKNDNFKKNYDMGINEVLSYAYLNLNHRNDKFKDIQVRKALTHAVNRDKINQVVWFGVNEYTEGIVHPKQGSYNKDLKATPFDLNLANKILDQAGWKDADGDGIREKMIGGRKIKLEIEYKYNSGNEQRKQTGLIIQEDFKKIGVRMNIIAKEGTVYSQEVKNQNFEMAYLSYTIPARGSDPKQVWHTASSLVGGDNSAGWGNSASDKIIDDLRKELDESKRNEYMKSLQKMIHDDYAIIPLFASKNRLIIKKDIDVERIILLPGFSATEMKR